MERRQNDGRTHAERKPRRVVIPRTTHRYRCPECRQTQALPGPCQALDCGGEVVRIKK
jgi:hypothetical protein